MAKLLVAGEREEEAKQTYRRYLYRLREKAFLPGPKKMRKKLALIEKHPTAAKASINLRGLAAPLKLCPFKTAGFSAGAEAHIDFIGLVRHD